MWVVRFWERFTNKIVYIVKTLKSFRKSLGWDHLNWNYEVFIEVTWADLFQFRGKPSDVSNCIFPLACIQSSEAPVVMTEKCPVSLMSHARKRSELMKKRHFLWEDRTLSIRVYFDVKGNEARGKNIHRM